MCLQVEPKGHMDGLGVGCKGKGDTRGMCSVLV